jgi:hypothetical protein
MSTLRKGKSMRGFSQAIAVLFVARFARGHARLFSAKTVTKKTTKQV